MKKNRALLLLLTLLPFLAILGLTGCKDFSFYGVLGDRISDNPLQISPAAISVAAGATVTFTATGGLPPYSFSVISGTGTGSINTGAGTADFTAGTSGTLTVRVTDTNNRRSDAAVTITPSGAVLSISPVNVSMGPGGKLTFVASGGMGAYTFSILPSPGSGSPTINIPAAGDYVAGNSLGIDTIQVRDSAVPAATATATVNVTAAIVTVDYSFDEASFNIPTPVKGGSAIGAGYTFHLQNAALADGTKPLYWWVYLSDDNTLGSGDTLLDADISGALGPLTAGGSADVPFNGTWPLASGPKYLFVMVAAADDFEPANNTSAAVPITLELPDYTGTLVHDTGTIAGASFTGRLTIDNVGTTDGSQDVSWSVYASLGDTDIDLNDKIVGSGTLPGGLAELAAPVEFSINNTWPSTAGGYYLVAAITAGDDVNTVNNRPNVSVSVTAPLPPDYAVSFLSGPPWSDLVSKPISGQIRIQNVSASNNGLSNVNYYVYRSADKVLGGDVLLLSGSQAALDAGAFVDLPAADGDLWPATGQFCFLIAAVSAADDFELSNNTITSHPIAVADARYVEGLENNGDAGPTPPPFAAVSLTGLTLNLNGTIALEGTMDAYIAANSQYDTYQFFTGAGVAGVSMKARWQTGYDDVDMYLWDENNNEVSSLATDIDSEPAGLPNLNIIGISAAKYYYTGMNFWLANNTSGSAGRPYVVLIKGNP